jgi:hypothetical protein
MNIACQLPSFVIAMGMAQDCGFMLVPEAIFIKYICCVRRAQLHIKKKIILFMNDSSLVIFRSQPKGLLHIDPETLTCAVE